MQFIHQLTSHCKCKVLIALPIKCQQQNAEVVSLEFTISFNVSICEQGLHFFFIEFRDKRADQPFTQNVCDCVIFQWTHCLPKI